MENSLHRLFHNRKADTAKLVSFGFVPEGGGYAYRTVLSQSGFQMTVFVTEQGEVSAEVQDRVSGEPYTLHFVADAAGSFVSAVRNQYEAVLEEIARRCFEREIYQTEQANRLLAYAKETYGDTPEFLWEKFPRYGVLRRKDTQKWYGVLLVVPGTKLGLPQTEEAEILNLRVPAEKLQTLLDHKTFFPCYHMNKKHWCTVLLDGTAAFADICRMLDQSYLLAVK